MYLVAGEKGILQQLFIPWSLKSEARGWVESYEQIRQLLEKLSRLFPASSAIRSRLLGGRGKRRGGVDVTTGLSRRHVHNSPFKQRVPGRNRALSR